MQGGRRGSQLFAVGFGIAHLLVHHLEHGTPIGRNGLHEGEEVRHPHVVHPASVEFRRKGDARQRGIAAVTCAVDGDAFGVGNALRLEPFHGVGDVVLHAQPPLFVGGLQKTAAVARGAAKVHAHHGIAPVAEKLHHG